MDWMVILKWAAGGSFFAALGFIGGIITKFTRIAEKTKRNEERINKIELEKDGYKRFLFDTEGTPIYLTVKDHKDISMEQRQIIGNEFEHFRKQTFDKLTNLQIAVERGLKLGEKNSERLAELHTAVAIIRQYIDDRNGVDLKT